MTILQDCQCNETNYQFLNNLRRIWYLINRTVRRYNQWHRMKHNHRLLFTMEDRMLKDIGLSRADAVRISNAHTFRKFMFQPESNDMKDRSCQNN
ncbi:MAG: DUF1127 domain-containing protein [Desulfobacula sp.]|nr:DUF1127 domain-containing protein [Desulfobacula sp.]